MLPFPAAEEVYAQERAGFWTAGGLAAGSQQLGDRPRETGGGGHVAIGGSRGDNLLVGGELNVWLHRGSSPTTQLGLSAVAYWYPTTSRFFLKGALGLAHLTFDDLSGRQSDLGVEAGVAIGYDLRLADGFAVRPFLSGALGGFPEGMSTRGEIGLGVLWQ
jgi:hypothetical protein